MNTIQDIVDEALRNAGYYAGTARNRMLNANLVAALDERDTTFGERVIDLLVGGDLAPHEDAVRIIAHARDETRYADGVTMRAVVDEMERAIHDLVNKIADLQQVVEETA